MDRRDDSAQAKRHKHSCAQKKTSSTISVRLNLWKRLTCSQRPQSALGELIPEADDDARDTEGAHDTQINHFGLEVAVETVVQPRHEASHDQERDSAII